MEDSTPDAPRKDRRLYAKFDIGMDEHTKIMFLSDAAFRALFESTLYSRRQLTDGFLDERVVKRKWGLEVAAELSSNDPERPSWIRVEGGWMIHDFAEHQTTTKDIEAKREAGRKGGLAKAKQEPSKTEAPAKHVLDVCSSKPLAKTETETETETKQKTPSSPATPSMEFDRFWIQYPRKVGKEAARKAFAKAMKKTTIDKVLSAVEDLRIRVAGKDQQFTPHPATWLNEGRWDDEITQPTLSIVPAGYGWANR
jgi:hypothetical protein